MPRSRALRCTALGLRWALLWLFAGWFGLAQAQLAVPAGATVTLPPGGVVNLACLALDVQGTLMQGDAQINAANNVGIGAGGTLNMGSGTLNVGGNWSNNGTFVAGSGTVSFVDGCGPGPVQIAGPTVFNNLTLNSTTGRSFVFAPGGGVIQVNGTLTIQGAPGAPLQVAGPAGQFVNIRLGPNAVVNLVNANVGANLQIGNGAGPAKPVAIPTLSEWALLLMASLLLMTALFRTRRSPPPRHR